MQMMNEEPNAIRAEDDEDEFEDDAPPGIDYEDEDEDEDELDEDELDEDEDELDEDEEPGAAGAANRPPPGEPEAHESAGDGVGRAAAVLKYIVERIVDEPDKISIGAAEDDRGPVLLLRVAEDDRGKVIGRQGRIVQAIRTVVKAATVGTGEKVSVEIID